MMSKRLCGTARGETGRGGFLLFLACFVLCCAASSCRTYVGSDDLYRSNWDTPVVLKRDFGLNRTTGVVLSPKNDAIELQFAEKSYNMRTEKSTKKERTGQKYYYYYPEIPNRIGYVLLFPFAWVYEIFSWTWTSYGENRPGFLYQVAYFPFIKILFQPILCSPSSVLIQDDGKDLHSEEEWGDWKTVREEIGDVYTPVFATDSSQTAVTIMYGNRKIEKTLSYDGKLSFSPADFIVDGIGSVRKASFTVSHPKWNKTWIVEAPATLNPDAIRDWNIFVDGQFDYPSRVNALNRLKPLLGETAYRDCCNRLLDGSIDKNRPSSMPREIRISSKQ